MKSRDQLRRALTQTGLGAMADTLVQLARPGCHLGRTLVAGQGGWEGRLKRQLFGHASPVQNEVELECDFHRRGEKERWDLAARAFDKVICIGQCH